MAQSGSYLRVFSLLALISFFITTYLVASRSQLSTSSISQLKTAAGQKWDHGLSLLSVSGTIRQPAGQSPDELEALINRLVDAKVAAHLDELKKRQAPSLGSVIGGLEGAGADPNATGSGASMSSALSGLLGSLTGGVGGSLMDSLGETSGPFGQGLAQGTIDGLGLPKNAGYTPPANTGIAGAAQSLGQGLSSTFTGEVNTSALMGSGMMIDLPATARALAVGLSNGTAMGLKLTPGPIGPPPAAGSMDPAAIAGNFGFGLTDTLFQYVNLNQAATPEQMQAIMMQVAQVVAPAASGLGAGTAKGLKLTAPGAPDGLITDPKNVQNAALAHDFNYALSSSFLGNIDMAMLAPNPNASAAMTQMVLQALPGIGNGIGSGTAIGLGLAKPVADPNTAVPTDFKSGSEDFSRSLTSSFWGSLDISKLLAMSQPAPGASSSMMSSMLGPAAEGLGKGFGEGTAIGLGLRQASPMGPINGMDTSAVAEAFSMNLVSSFLANGSAQKLAQDAAALSAVAPPLNVSKLTEGFGRGLVDGVQTGLGIQTPPDTFDDGVQGGSIGFAKGLSEASTMLVMNLISNPAALGNLGALGAPPAGMAPAPAPASPAPNMPAAPAPATDSPPAAPAAPAPAADSPPAAPAAAPPASGSPMPAGDMPPAAMPAGDMPPASMPAGDMPQAQMPANANNPVGGPPPSRRAEIVKRQDISPAVPSIVSSGMDGGLASLNQTAITEMLLKNLNETQVNAMLQKQIDALTCTGFGGVWSLAQGLTDSGFFQKNPLMGGKPIPGFGNTTFTVVSNKNTFKVSPGLGQTRTNGVLLPRSVLLLTIHGVFGSLAFFNFMPIVFMLAGFKDIADMIGRPQLMINSARNQFITQLLGFMPFSIVTVATGAIVIGNGAHFNTPHKVMGWILFIVGLVWVATSRASNASDTPGTARLVNTGVVVLLIGLSVAVEITGWNDLATISLCLTQIVSADAFIGLGILVGSLFANAMGVMLIVVLMGKWIGYPQTSGNPEKGDLSRTNTRTPTAREVQRISGPFLPNESRMS